jgi:hypothetical protein
MERRRVRVYAAVPSGYGASEMADLFGYEAPPIEPGFVEIACELREQTRDAIAIVARADRLTLSSAREIWTWLPLSEVKTIERGQNNFAVVTIPDRLAKEKGLR